MANPDVSNKCIEANPIKFGGIICSTKVTGESSKHAETYHTSEAPDASGLMLRLENRFDDPTYYTA